MGTNDQTGATGKENRGGISRRNFVKGAATATAVAAAVPLQPWLGSNLAHAQSTNPGTARADACLQIRVAAAQFERNQPIPQHPTNGDEQLLDTKIGNYSKGLPHNQFGEVDLGAYQTMLNALNSGSPADFENITLGGGRKLVNPQSGLAFDMEGADSHALAIPPAFNVQSPDRAAEMVENYWQALTRDVPFSQYGQEPLTAAAIAELDKLAQRGVFHGPTQNGHVTANTLFRGLTPEDQIGPYVSQFFLMPAPFGALTVNDDSGNPAQRYNSVQPGIDFMTTTDEWLRIQNGFAPSASLTPAGPRFINAARVLNMFVHVDELYQAYFMATLNLLDRMQCDFNPGNPYINSRTQVGFGTFGNPHAVALVAEVSTRALKAVWYQKWFVHRALRPEAFSGLVHFQIKNNRPYGLDPVVLNSDAASRVFSKNGTGFLPMAFPEGSPTHPSYGAGHATVAGACATFIKAFFNEDFPITAPVVASDDGKTLLTYTGPGFDKMTVKSEANKIASNVGLARNSAGVHWRSDQTQSVLLGEEIAISILQDQKGTYNEAFGGFTFTKFDGTKVTV